MSTMECQLKPKSILMSNQAEKKTKGRKISWGCTNVRKFNEYLFFLNLQQINKRREIQNGSLLQQQQLEEIKIQISPELSSQKKMAVVFQPLSLTQLELFKNSQQKLNEAQLLSPLSKGCKILQQNNGYENEELYIKNDNLIDLLKQNAENCNDLKNKVKIESKLSLPPNFTDKLNCQLNSLFTNELVQNKENQNINNQQQEIDSVKMKCQGKDLLDQLRQKYNKNTVKIQEEKNKKIIKNQDRPIQNQLIVVEKDDFKIAEKPLSNNYFVQKNIETVEKNNSITKMKHIIGIKHNTNVDGLRERLAQHYKKIETFSKNDQKCQVTNNNRLTTIPLDDKFYNQQLISYNFPQIKSEYEKGRSQIVSFNSKNEILAKAEQQLKRDCLFEKANSIKNIIQEIKDLQMKQMYLEEENALHEQKHLQNQLNIQQIINQIQEIPKSQHLELQKDDAQGITMSCYLIFKIIGVQLIEAVCYNDIEKYQFKMTDKYELCYSLKRSFTDRKSLVYLKLSSFTCIDWMKTCWCCQNNQELNVNLNPLNICHNLTKIVTFAILHFFENQSEKISNQEILLKTSKLIYQIEHISKAINNTISLKKIFPYFELQTIIKFNNQTYQLQLLLKILSKSDEESEINYLNIWEYRNSILPIEIVLENNLGEEKLKLLKHAMQQTFDERDFHLNFELVLYNIIYFLFLQN